MKDKNNQVKRAVCGVIMTICIILLLGYTGECEKGSSLIEYAVRGAVVLIIAIIAGIIGDLFE